MRVFSIEHDNADALSLVERVIDLGNEFIGMQVFEKKLPYRESYVRLHRKMNR